MPHAAPFLALALLASASTARAVIYPIILAACSSSDDSQTVHVDESGVGVISSSE
jgi:sialate O-acetylesterase